MVPAIGRTDPDLTPHRRMASRALPQLRVRREPEIVVRRQIDDRSTLDRRVRPLLAIQHTHLPVEVLLVERVQVGGEIVERILAHGRSVSKTSHKLPGGQPVRAGSGAASVWLVVGPQFLEQHLNDRGGGNRQDRADDAQ